MHRLGMSRRREMLLVFAAAKESQRGSRLIFESGQSNCVRALISHNRLVITGSRMGRIDVEAADKLPFFVTTERTTNRFLSQSKYRYVCVESAKMHTEKSRKM
jgi:hypothetical protein